ncbi:MAG: hypothetical protein V4510_06015 [bacterium]
MMHVLVAVVILHPVLAEPGDVRLVAAGTGGASTEWAVDGAHVASTADREAAVVHLQAGGHRIEAESHASRAWIAIARVVPAQPGLAYVPSWSGGAAGEATRPIPVDLPVVGVAVAAAGLRRHSKGP